MPADLYLITDRHLVRDLPQTLGRIAASVPRGALLIQLREKDLSARALFALACEVIACCPETPVLINDRLDVALAAGAAGVHLTGRSLFARDLRHYDCMLGASTHSTEEAVAMSGASFFTYGPVFETPSKRTMGSPQGLPKLAAFAKAQNIPVYALGGISRVQIAEVIACGVQGVAVIRGILGAADPAQEACAFVEEIREARVSRENTW